VGDLPDHGNSSAAQRWRWTLEPGCTFLNHGSFGATPAAVLEAQAAIHDRMEAQPVRFFARELLGLLDGARAALGAFLGADPAGLVFVANATTGVNAVLRSRAWQPGDELLTTDHAYPACRDALEYVAGRTGARVVVAQVPFPLRDPQQVIDALLAQVTPSTRLALIDHVTSPTALVFPVEQLVPALQDRGVDVLVDGAHAPGMLPLALDALGAAYYAANAHKWICAPKGAAFLHVREDRRDETVPPVISLGGGMQWERSRFHRMFDWQGTDDPSAVLSIPAALEEMASMLPGGWDEVRRRNRSLALRARDLLCEALEIGAPCPDGMVGAMAAVPLPDGSGPASFLGADALQEALWDGHGIEVPVIGWPATPRRLMRISAQLYNTGAEFQRLAGALRELLGG